MQCPMYVDYSRKCQYKIGFLPLDTRTYCATDNYEKCPFYIAIKDLSYSCKYFKQCPAFAHFKAENFDAFVAISKEYCLSEENNHNCKRFKIRKAGNVSPPDLMPDGSTFK